MTDLERPVSGSSMMLVDIGQLAYMLKQAEDFALSMVRMERERLTNSEMKDLSFEGFWMDFARRLGAVREGYYAK